MIRIFKLVLLLVVSQVAFGQAPTNYTNINGRYRWIAGMFDSTFHIPKGTTPSLRTGGSTNAGAVFYNTSDSSVYTYTGTQWIKLRGTITDTTSLSNRINLKLNISDTASMLSPYLRKVDTTNKFVTQVYKKNGSDSVFYVRGGNHLWAFNDSTGNPGGGGGGKIYYFNGGVSMGTFGGFTMYELGDTANTGAAANFTRATTGNIANFITDPGKPGLLQIPAGVWTIDAYLSETGGGSNNAEIYVQVEKWDGSTITTIATSPIEQITNGSVIDLYTWAVSIPTTSLAVTDRIIIQFYIQNTNGKTVTLYTQNGYVGEVHTTFTTGIGAINGLTAPAQYLVTGTSGTDFNISSVTATHTFNLPTASATNRGALSSADWTAFNNKGSVSSVATNNATGITGGTITTTGTLAIDTTVISTRLWRQKGIDSVQSNLTAGLALKVNISDTSSMLLPYLRKVDTASLSNRINLKVNISDTASMLSPYLRAIDTASLSNRINLKVNISDTSSMLNPYLRKTDTTSMLANYVNAAGYGLSKAGQVLSADSATLSNYYLRRKDSLTATNLLGYVTSKILADTASAIRSSDAGGSVTSVATNNSTGITGGTITTAGTLAIDTLLIATRAWRQKGIDSVQGNLTAGLATKLNISDTASMLSPYLRKVDTASLSNRINTKLNISDTATMLGNYVNNVGYGLTKASQVVSADSATLSAYYLRRKDSLTSTNLLGYVTRTVLADSAAAIRAAAGGGSIGGSGTINRLAKFTASGTIGNGSIADSSSSVAMTISSAGNVGIGTTSPGQLLDVNGTGRFSNNLQLGTIGGGTSTATPNSINLTSTFSNSAGSNLKLKLFEDTGGNIYGLGVSNNQMDFNVPSGATYRFYTGAATFSSNVGIATTTIGSRLQVNGNAAIGYSASTAAPTNGLAVSGNVGIGTTSPLGNLDVSTSGNTAINITAGSTALSRLIFGTTSGNSRGFIDYDNTSSVRAMIFRTNESERMRITSGGNIGIGTTTIGSTLQVNGNAAIGYSASTAAPTNGLAVSGNIGVNTTGSAWGSNYRVLELQKGSSFVNNNATNYTGVYSNAYFNGTNDIYFSSSFALKYQMINGEHIWYNSGIGSTGGVVSFNSAMILNNSSNLGLGTSPDSRLHISSGATRGLRIDVNSGTQAFSMSPNGIFGIDEPGSTNGRFIINTSGNVGIATTTIGSRLQVNGNAAIGYSASTAGPTNGLAVSGDVSIGTNTANSKLHVAGSLRLPITTKTATYTLDATDYTVVFDLNGNATANLPDATTIPGRIYVIKINRTSVTDTLTIDPNGAQTIDGNATLDLLCQQAITIQSDGTNWRVIGDYLGGLNCL